MTDYPILVPFGPTGPVPAGHQHCFACDGTGEDTNANDAKEKCPVCAGKGFHSPQDIDRYHQAYPELCRKSCGPVHLTPSYDDHPLDRAEVDAALAHAKELLRRYGKK
ncbi:MAG: hypothetical protein WCT10_05205 [Patescibacteria group bacterium]|jgi:hypothetical protein